MLAKLEENYHKWYSAILNLDIEMLVFGHSGRPIILFPTSMGRYYEAKDHGLIQSIEWFINNGFAKVYCPDSVDSLSWYNKGVPPSVRARNHNFYDQFIYEEVISRAKHETGWENVCVAGCSFGGYHAANFGFKHPSEVNSIISMGGAFDISGQVDGYFDDNVYFNNPVSFLPKDYNPALWQLEIILGTTSNDICLDQNKRLSEILYQKNIHHWMDIRGNANHDWPIWKEMFPHYLSIL